MFGVLAINEFKFPDSRTLCHPAQDHNNILTYHKIQDTYHYTVYKAKDSSVQQL